MRSTIRGWVDVPCARRWRCRKNASRRPPRSAVTASPRSSASRPPTRADQGLVADAAVEQRIGAEIFDADDLAPVPSLAAEMRRARDECRVDRRAPRARSQARSLPAMTAPRAPRSSRSRFIGGVPMKRATKVLARAFRTGPPASPFCSMRPAQQDHAVGHRHRLDLVVRDVDHGHAERALQPADFVAHLVRAAARRGWTAARPSGTPAPRR